MKRKKHTKFLGMLALVSMLTPLVFLHPSMGQPAGKSSINSPASNATGNTVSGAEPTEEPTPEPMPEETSAPETNAAPSGDAAPVETPTAQPKVGFAAQSAASLSLSFPKSEYPPGAKTTATVQLSGGPSGVTWSVTLSGQKSITPSSFTLKSGGSKKVEVVVASKPGNYEFTATATPPAASSKSTASSAGARNRGKRLRELLDKIRVAVKSRGKGKGKPKPTPTPKPKPTPTPTPTPLKFNEQKQAGHVFGTPQYKNRAKQGKPTSYFSTMGVAKGFVKTAWNKGTPVAGRPGVRDFNFGYPVGKSPNGKNQHSVRVHMDGQRKIHGHPVGPEF